MTGQAGLRASRVRKARGESCCGLCGAPVRVGDWIGFIEQRFWCHVRCVIEHNAAASARQDTSPGDRDPKEAN